MHTYKNICVCTFVCINDWNAYVDMYIQYVYICMYICFYLYISVYAYVCIDMY